MELSVRMAAGVALMAGCTLFGRGMALAQRRRTKFLEEGIRGLRALERGICLRKRQLAAALQESGFDPFMRVGQELAEKGDAPQTVWNGLEKIYERQCLPADRAVLTRLFEGLGNGDLTAQADLLADVRQGLMEQLTQARKRQEETGKLYPSLGALAGLAMAILLY